MAVTKFHMAWFLAFGSGDWRGSVGMSTSPWDGKTYVEMARQFEQACFDFVMIADTLMISDVYGGSAETALKYSMFAPLHDPFPLATIMAASTSRIGVVSTMSTLSYHPFQLARLCATADHIANGRFGWNIVTSSEDLAAQNYGLDALPPHDLRYEMADEFVDLACRLWESWDRDAVVLDREGGVYADHTKVRPVNFKGKFYSSRGPLNTARPPQGRPVFVQAGASERGLKFAATHAEAIIGLARGVEGMKRYRGRIRQLAAEAGRNPDDVKVLFLTHPTVAETDAEAQAKRKRLLDDPASVVQSLASMSAFTNIDLSQFDPDKPLPDLATNGGQGSLERFSQKGSGKTLRQLALAEYDEAGDPDLDFVGSPDTVADKMIKVMNEVGGDGFLISAPMLRHSRKVVAEFTDGLMPALRKRGAVRSAYGGPTFRDNLKEF
ncbi:NtaA/DmoA family FMN-dependent monooxygenase [Mesorhizobium sp. ASY16-5R]|uniref:NtaA/DmoA family FMN-dependent monooxygenase n=1 Tax=Mesorhizobium sp. ASY16-5R TaxID=3445772 RepID=UPI003FA045CD